MFSRTGYLGALAILGLMGLTLYMAFAFPYSLFQVKQSDASELKAVIIVGRSGDRSPTKDSYFSGENPPDDLETLGYKQLTNTGKERMYLLGKFLKLRYESLLSGSPREIYARSEDTDRALESSQSLLAGLNPPKDRWVWSASSELSSWQPSPVHTVPARSDDLLSFHAECPRLELEKRNWKNSTRYHQLLKEFRHELQSLRSKTGLHFESDLEMIANIQESLEVRKGYNMDSGPSWYTNTFANSLTHIVDMTTESFYSSQDIQRLSTGRLLYEISQNLNSKIRQHETSEKVSTRGTHHHSPVDGTDKQKVPNVFVYMTDKEQLSALMSALQIYSSDPIFGTLLLVELHYSSVDHVHFLRLFTSSPSSANVFPDPVRVNPTACVDTAECNFAIFQQNLRHLMMDKNSWQEACVMIPITETTTATSYEQEDSSEKRLQESSTAFTESTTLAETASQLLTTIKLPNESVTNSTELDKLDDNLIVGPTHSTPSDQQQETTFNSAEQQTTTNYSQDKLDTSTSSSEMLKTSTATTNSLLNSTQENFTAIPTVNPSTSTESGNNQQPDTTNSMETSSNSQSKRVDTNDSVEKKEAPSTYSEGAIFQPFTQPD